MATKFRSLREFLFPAKQLSITVPNYQRGYKWGVKYSSDSDSSAEYLTKSIIEAWNSDTEKLQTFFLQGITVVEDENEVVLVDGQQRITTLYLMLRVLDYDDISNVELKYDVRKDSQNYLTGLVRDKRSFSLEVVKEDIKDTQDIRYFKQAMKQMHSLLAGSGIIDPPDNRLSFIDFLMDQVSFLYVVVDKEQAVNTFTLMNGHKATMHQEELVKAQLLHMASSWNERYKQTTPANMDEAFELMRHFIAVEWECDAMRSRYAREWDRWLYWWNRDEVRSFFDSGKQPLGILLRYYAWEKYCENKTSDGLVFSFGEFKKYLQQENASKIFIGLRKLQKKFEDAYSLPIIHNHIKLALICANRELDRFDIIRYFFQNLSRINELKEYALWRLTGATHKSIVRQELDDDGKCKEDYAREAYQRLSENIVYNADGMEDAYRQLLRLNVEEYDKLNDGKGLAFDFSVWSNRSLEHIYPKSHFFHQEKTNGKEIYVNGDGVVISEIVAATLKNRDDFFLKDGQVDGSEHCIGNLVLLYKDNNSKFGDSDFAAKKKIYFDTESDFKFASRGLLHSVSVFAESKWEGDEIRNHRDRFLERFRKDYGMEVNDIKGV